MPGRALARWREPFCVGVTDMEPTAAQAMADRLSDWAHVVGLAVAEPGCLPNVLIIATEDGNRTASDLIEARRSLFATGVWGSDRGSGALHAFRTSGQAVRWWHVSLPVDPDTGRSIRRLLGQKPIDLTYARMSAPMDFAGYGNVVAPSRFARPMRDDLKTIVVVVESRALDSVSFGQLSDYVAMVALAQVAPDMDTRGFDSILNLFEPSAAAPDALTAWDRTFLEGLYGGANGREEGSGAMAEAMRRTLNDPC